MQDSFFELHPVFVIALHKIGKLIVSFASTFLNDESLSIIPFFFAFFYILSIHAYGSVLTSFISNAISLFNRDHYLSVRGEFPLETAAKPNLSHYLLASENHGAMKIHQACGSV